MPPGASRYLDIAAELRERILGGEWEPGATMPRMSELARGYGVNRDTLARPRARAASRPAHRWIRRKVSTFRCGRSSTTGLSLSMQYR